MGKQYYIHIIEQLENYTIIVFVCIANNKTRNLTVKLLT